MLGRDGGGRGSSGAFGFGDQDSLAGFQLGNAIRESLDLLRLDPGSVVLVQRQKLVDRPDFLE